MTFRNTIAFDPAKGFPAGRRIRYGCLLCGATLPSVPEHAEGCRCENILVDPDAGRVKVGAEAQVNVYEID